jgi:hypothetical protein
MSRLVKYAFYAFLISVPIGTRVLLHQFTTGFDEYEAVFLYASDVFMLIFLAGFFWKYGWWQFWEERRPLFLKIFLVLALVSVFFAQSIPLAVYNFLRLLLIAVFALVTAKFLRLGGVGLRDILTVTGGSAVPQSLIGFSQFARQSGLGLARLGEPVIGPNVGGAAKIIAEGGKVLRAYGTLPHPNVLAAFLIFGLISLIGLWFLFSQGKAKFFLAPAIFVVLLGVVLTFSRAGWAVTALATVVCMIYGLSRAEFRRKSLGLLVVLATGILVFTAIFHQFIFPRARVSASEPAVTQRLFYNKLAFSIIRNNLLGVGIGNQVLHSVKNEIYQKFGMDKVWQWQPIHNIYLLIASEVSVLGLLSFLIFVGTALVSSIKYQVSSQIPAIMLLALLTLGLFDHFLWTLQPGRLMLWIIIGIVLAQAPVVKRI